MKFVLFSLLLFFSCTNSKIKFPKVEKGILDLGSFTYNCTNYKDCKSSNLNPKQILIPLEGEWEFYWKEFYTPEDFANPAKQEEIAKKREWIKVPSTIQDRDDMEKPGLGYSTYRVIIKGENLLSLTHIQEELISTAYRVFSNGVLVSELGIPSTSQAIGNAIEKINIIKLQNLQKETLELIFHVSNFNHRSYGIIRTPLLGTEEAAYQIQGNFYKSSIFFFGAFFIFSMYHLGLFLLRRNDKSPLYFSFITLLLSIRPMLTSKYILDDYPFLTWEIVSKLEYLTVSLTPSFILLFFQALFPLELSKKISNFLLSIALTLSLIIVFGSIYIVSSILTVFQLLAVVCAILCLWTLIKAIPKNRLGSKSLMFGSLFLVGTLINDILYQKEIIDTGYYIAHGLFIFIFSQSYVLSKRFSIAFQESQEQRRLLTQAKSEIEKLSKTKDEFLANLSHELKTPLSVVFAYSQMIPTNKENPKKVEKYAEQIFLNASKLNEYVSDLILVTDIESNLELQKTEADIQQMVDSCISSLSNLITEKSIQVDKTEVQPFSVECDPILLSKALKAVLKNAITYNKYSGNIKFRMQINHEYLQLHILDTGIGIEREMQNKIFEKFFRVDSSLNYEVSGVGIGLFLAKKIIELHEGRILVQSEIGKGSEFCIFLPITQKEDKRDE